MQPIAEVENIDYVKRILQNTCQLNRMPPLLLDILLRKSSDDAERLDELWTAHATLHGRQDGLLAHLEHHVLVLEQLEES